MQTNVPHPGQRIRQRTTGGEHHAPTPTQQAEDVVDREVEGVARHSQHSVLDVNAQIVVNGIDGGAGLLVGDHHTLRGTGRAGGEDDVRHLAGVPGGCGHLGEEVGGKVPGGNGGQTRECNRTSRHICTVSCGQRRHSLLVGRSHSRLIQYQWGVSPGSGSLSGQLLHNARPARLRPGSIQRHIGTTGHENRQLGGHLVATCRQRQRHRLPRLQGAQRNTNGQGEVKELAVGYLSPRAGPSQPGLVTLLRHGPDQHRIRQPRIDQRGIDQRGIDHSHRIRVRQRLLHNGPMQRPQHACRRLARSHPRNSGDHAPS